MRMRPLATMAGLAACAALAAGCGGGHGEAPAEGAREEEKALTKAEYLKRADAICLRLNEDTSVKYTAFYKQNPKPTLKQLRTMTDRVYLGNLEGRLRALREVPPPIGDSDQIEGLLQALSSGIRRARARQALAFTNTEEQFKKANSSAARYGFRYCYEV